MKVKQVGGARRIGLWGLALVATMASSAALWAFAAGVQGAEQGAPTYKGKALAAVRTAVVGEGSISSSLSYTGEIKAVSQLSVLPKASGRIERLLVGVGDRVSAGSPIAELDADAARVQVSQAMANLAMAESRYETTREGARREQVAQARAGLDMAEARRDVVRKGATEADLQAAQSAVDAARANLQIARARQETLKIGPTQAELVAAHAAVNSALAAWKAAQANLEEVRSGPRPAELQAAQAAVESARAQLYAADDRKDMYRDASDEARLSIGVTSGSQAERAADAARAAYDAAVERLNLLRSKPLPVELADAEGRTEAARATYDSSLARLEQLKKGPTPQDLQQADGAVAAAEAALAGAEARLRQLQAGPTEEDLRIAESAVTQAQEQYNLASNPFTRHDLDAAQAGVDQARAAVELAELALKETVVVSPVDGVVAERFLTVGSLVSPQTPIMSVVSDGVEMVLGVEEAAVGRIRQGLKAEITVAAFPGKTMPAEVSLISPTADPKTRTFQVRIRPEAPGGQLRQGMAAQVRIVTEEHDRALLVPKEAVVNRSGETRVYVMEGDRVEARPVKLGIVQNGTAEIVGGLRLGEEIVVAGQGELRDGDEVARAS